MSTAGRGSIAREIRVSSKERSRDVTSTAQRNDRLRELDDDTRRAWDEYVEALRELSGDEYELVEHDSWERLQEELQGVERRRASLGSEQDETTTHSD
jgi:hypothetical protein